MNRRVMVNSPNDYRYLSVQKDPSYPTFVCWGIWDVSGDVAEGPFRTREEARAYLRDLQSGKRWLGGSARYRNPVLEKQYQDGLVAWRKRNGFPTDSFMPDPVTAS